MFDFFDDADLVGEEISLKIVGTFPLSMENDIPSYLFHIVRNADHRVVGQCTLRVKDDENIYYRGNIGFSVLEEYRGNRYAAKAVKLVIRQARKHHMPYVYITCEKGNIASYQSIVLAGGQFIEQANVPVDSIVYKNGGKFKNIFQFLL